MNRREPTLALVIATLLLSLSLPAVSQASLPIGSPVATPDALNISGDTYGEATYDLELVRGNPAVAFEAESRLVYSRWRSGSWESETVAETGLSSRSAEQVFQRATVYANGDSDPKFGQIQLEVFAGEPGILYFDKESGLLGFAARTRMGWQIERIDQCAEVHSSLDEDSGFPAVAYGCERSSSTGNSSLTVKLATRNEGDWRVESLSEQKPGDSAFDIGLDYLDGNPLIALTRNSDSGDGQSELVIFQRNSEGEWENQVVARRPGRYPRGGFKGLVLGASQQKLHLVTVEYPPGTEFPPSIVRYRRLSSENDLQEELDEAVLAKQNTDSPPIQLGDIEPRERGAVLRVTGGQRESAVDSILAFTPQKPPQRVWPLPGSRLRGLAADAGNIYLLDERNLLTRLTGLPSYERAEDSFRQVTLNSEIPDELRNEVAVLKWDLRGDGNWESYGRDFQADHQYLSSGFYTPRLLVEPKAGSSYTVRVALPLTDFGAPEKIDEKVGMQGGNLGLVHDLVSRNDQPAIVAGFGVTVYGDFGFASLARERGSWRKSVIRDSTYSGYARWTPHLKTTSRGGKLSIATSKGEIITESGSGWRQGLFGTPPPQEEPGSSAGSENFDVAMIDDRLVVVNQPSGSESIYLSTPVNGENSGWEREEVASGITTSSLSLLEIGGQPAIAVESDSGLYYFESQGDGWSRTKVAGDDGSGESAVEGEPVLLTRNGQPAIAFGQEGLKLASRDGKSWTVSLVREKGSVSDAVVYGGRPVICFNTTASRWDDRVLKLARKNDKGWQFYTLDARRGGDCSIAQIGDNLGVSSFTDYTYDLVYWEIGREEW